MYAPPPVAPVCAPRWCERKLAVAARFVGGTPLVVAVLHMLHWVDSVRTVRNPDLPLWRSALPALRTPLVHSDTGTVVVVVGVVGIVALVVVDVVVLLVVLVARSHWAARHLVQGTVELVALGQCSAVARQPPCWADLLRSSSSGRGSGFCVYFLFFLSFGVMFFSW